VPSGYSRFKGSEPVPSGVLSFFAAENPDGAFWNVKP